MALKSAPENGNPHEGHRQRLKEQFLSHGLDTLADVNVLELILFYAVPRKDTNVLAHQLLSTFGSLSAVFDASAEELVSRGGLTENAAALLKLIPAAARRYQISRSDPGEILDTTEKLGEYLLPFFFDETEECLYLLGLDAKCKALGCTRLSTGAANQTELNVRKVVEAALSMKAVSVVLAHNHLSGSPVPSTEDISATRTAAHALELVGICLADHIVTAGTSYVSMAESGLLSAGI